MLFDQAWFQKIKNPEKIAAYYIYRNVKKEKGLRFDITVIPPKILGKEFVKTKGNRNSDNFLEIYTVLQGQAIFLLQKMAGEKIQDIVAIKAKKGDFVIDPVGYYIVSINPTNKILKLGNWISEKNKNIYKVMEEKHGAGYYYTQAGWIKNKNYSKVPRLKFKRPGDEIGKHAGFRSLCRKAWEFKSPPGH